MAGIAAWGGGRSGGGHDGRPSAEKLACRLSRARVAAAFRRLTQARPDGARATATSPWRQVPAAVLLQDAAEPAHALSQASLEPLVRARWTAPGGAPPEGEVYAPGGASAGTTVMVWTDPPGRLEGAPVQRADVTVLEAFAALAAAALAAVAVAVTGFLARRALDRRRLAAWDAGWSRTGPQWTGRS